MTALSSRRALPLLLVVLVAACGGHGTSDHGATSANTALLDRIPVYPTARAPTTTPGESFSARDWTLPKHTAPTVVIDWYIARLQAAGWKVSGRSFDTIRATRAHASLSVGVRARTLEVVANSTGA